MQPVLLVALLLVAAPLLPSAPRLVAGEVPAPPSPRTVGGGEVVLEAEVDSGGKVAGVKVLRDTPPFTAALSDAVAGWSFESGAAGYVLVAGLFAPPTLYGPAPGQPPRDVASPSEEVPYPSTRAPAPYPPGAVGSGSVLVEVEVDAAGTVASAKVVRSAPGFDESALRAARAWRFRPARREGKPTASFVYLVFGFRAPVVPPPPPPPRSQGAWG
jgi:protein TonB